MKMRSVVQFGKSSLAIIIPAAVVKRWLLEKGDVAKVKETPHGLTIEFVPREDDAPGVRFE